MQKSEKCICTVCVYLDELEVEDIKMEDITEEEVFSYDEELKNVNNNILWYKNFIDTDTTIILPSQIESINVYNSDYTYLGKESIVKSIKKYMLKTKQSSGSDKKKNAFYAIYLGVQLIKYYDEQKFKEILIKKINEFKKDSLVNEKDIDLLNSFLREVQFKEVQLEVEDLKDEDLWEDLEEDFIENDLEEEDLEDEDLEEEVWVLRRKMTGLKNITEKKMETILNDIDEMFISLINKNLYILYYELRMDLIKYKWKCCIKDFIHIEEIEHDLNELEKQVSEKIDEDTALDIDIFIDDMRYLINVN